MVFASAVGDFIAQGFVCLCCVVGLIGMMLKRADQGGKVKSAAGKAAFRGGWALFKHLTK